MVKFVYIDETGSTGKGAKKQPLLTLAAVLVPEDKVQELAAHVRMIAQDHLGHSPSGFELHGNEIWGGKGYWSEKSYPELIEVYEASVSAIEEFSLEVSWASIHKQRLHDRHGGEADGNAYLLALQFLLEKIDRGYSGLKVLIADEHKEHQLRAINMVANLQEWGAGEVPGRQLKNVIDSIHFVSSSSSPGVQMADLVAYALQRQWAQTDSHPDAKAGIARIHATICEHASTWRESWPRTTE